MAIQASPEFDRYQRASVAHTSLQTERHELGDADDRTAEQQAHLDDLDAALGVTSGELGAARDAYLRETT
jgi:hypothetical protein